jgi:hypothetical protein
METSKVENVNKGHKSLKMFSGHSVYTNWDLFCTIWVSLSEIVECIGSWHKNWDEFFV